MSFAFEVTDDDVVTVFRMNGLPVAYDSEELERAMEVVSAEAGRIEKAALREIEIEEQTEAAHEEIEAVLREAGFIF